MTDNQNQTPESDKKSRTFVEELEVAGDQLVHTVRELIQRGNVRRIVVSSPEGRVYMEIPLTVGVLAGSAMLFFTPLLAALGAIGALLVRVRIEIIRDGDDGGVREAVVDTGAVYDDVKKKVEGVADSAKKTYDNWQSKSAMTEEDANDAAENLEDQVK
jgi:hypothetical protein